MHAESLSEIQSHHERFSSEPFESLPRGAAPKYEREGIFALSQRWCSLTSHIHLKCKKDIK
jgi:hypothetical protein